MGAPLPPPARSFSFRPLPLLLGLAVAVVAAAYPLVPETARPLNLAAFGAIALFVAARAGMGPALLIALGIKLCSDLLNYRLHGYDPDYLPMASVYFAFAMYAVLGWWFLRKSESPLRIAGVTVAAGLVFFLVTNFFAWLGQALPYEYSAAGLLNSYVNGLPHYRGTLLGDLFFCGLLFGLHAVLSRTSFPAERTTPVAEEVRV